MRSPNKIKAVLVTNVPAPYRVPMLRRVAEQNDVELEVIYCAQPHIDLTLDDDAHGFKPHFLRGRYVIMEKRFMHADLSIVSLLNRLRPDVVITTGFIPTFLFAFAWAFVKGAAHVAMTDGTLQSETGLSRVHRWVRRIVFKRTAAFVGASNGSLELFKSYGTAPDRLHLARLCVHNDRFNLPRTPDSADFLFSGRFLEHKRPLFAMQVARRVAEILGRKTTIDFLGQGSQESEMRAFAETIRDQVEVRFLGYVSQAELPKCFAAARIFLFPSEWDPWGLVANEACAAGLPVIVSPHAGVAGELIQDGVNGYVRPLELEAWAGASVALLRDSDLYQRLSQQGQAMVAAYNFDNAAEGLANAIRQAVAQRNFPVSRPNSVVSAGIPEMAHQVPPILIATAMRADGDTGVQTHFRTFQTWVQQKGMPISLVTPYDSPLWLVYPVFALRRLIDPLHKVASVWWYRHWHALFLRRALRTSLADGQPCTIYAQCPLSADAALRSRAAPNQRVAMVVHFNISQADEWAGKGMVCEGDALYRAILRFESEVVPRLDGLVFVSEFMRREVVSRIPAAESIPYRIVPNFMPDPGLDEKRAEPGTDLICIGTLEPRKNQRYALEIVAAAMSLGRPLSLTVVGDGPDRAMLESLATQLGVRQQVVFAGFVRNAAGLMPKHRAFLHVARMESFGIVLIEAMAHGLPVFASAVGGVPEVFVEDCEGRFIPLDAAETAAKKIIDWLDSPQTLAIARQAARDRFLARFEAERVAVVLTDFLNHIDGPARRAFGQALENVAA